MPLVTQIAFGVALAAALIAFARWRRAEAGADSHHRAGLKPCPPFHLLAVSHNKARHRAGTQPIAKMEPGSRQRPTSP